MFREVKRRWSSLLPLPLPLCRLADPTWPLSLEANQSHSPETWLDQAGQASLGKPRKARLAVRSGCEHQVGSQPNRDCGSRFAKWPSRWSERGSRRSRERQHFLLVEVVKSIRPYIRFVKKKENSRHVRFEIFATCDVEDGSFASLWRRLV